MKRAQIVKIKYHPNDERIGQTGWVKKVGVPVGWTQPIYTFYPDGIDATYALHQGDFVYLDNL